MSAAISTHEKVGSNVDLYPSGTAWNVAHAGYIGLRGISAVLLDRTPLREMSRFHGLGNIFYWKIEDGESRRRVGK